MKKQLFGLAFLAAIMLASCSENETIDRLPQKAESKFAFNAVTPKVINSKAVESTIRTLEAGVPLYAFIETQDELNNPVRTSFFNDTLKKEGTSWKTKQTHYVTDATNYRFFSVFPANAASASDFATAEDYTFTYELEKLVQTDTEFDSHKPNVDLVGTHTLIATQGGSGIIDNDPTTPRPATNVNLVYNHLLAQVNFGVRVPKGESVEIGRAANTNPRMGDVAISNVVFHNVGSKGNCTFSQTNTVAWSDVENGGRRAMGTDINGTYTLGEIKTWTLDSYISTLKSHVFDREKYSQMWIPGPLTGSIITFEFQAYKTILETDSNEEIAKKEITNGKQYATIYLEQVHDGGILEMGTQWKPGMRYTYIIDFENFFTSRKLKFQVIMNPWENWNWDGVTGGGDGVVEVWVSENESLPTLR